MRCTNLSFVLMSTFVRRWNRQKVIKLILLQKRGRLLLNDRHENFNYNIIFMVRIVHTGYLKADISE